MNKDAKEVVLGCWAAANRHDAEGLDQYYAADVVYHGNDGEIRGRDAVKAYLGRYMEAMPDLRLTVEDIFGEDDRVFSRVRLQGTNIGSFNGAPATGRTIDVKWVMNATKVENGVIVEEWEICDQFDILSQLGLASAALSAS